MVRFQPLRPACAICAEPLKITLIEPQTKHRCSECKHLTKIDANGYCLKHPLVKTKEVIFPFHKKYYCTYCKGHRRADGSPSNKKNKLEKRMTVDRNLIKLVKKRNSKKIFFANIVDHLQKTNGHEIIQELFPQDILETIISSTESDKWVEKTKLENIITWALSFFITPTSKKSLTIAGIANASHSYLSSIILGERVVISQNALSVRFEKKAVNDALEQSLLATSLLLGTQAFDQTTTLLPIYYDWMYLIKKASSWKICKEISSGCYGIKVGFGRDLETDALVSLTFHGTDHPADRPAFEEYLMISDRPGIIHITDKGPYSTKLFQKINDNDQYFIIGKRKDVSPIIDHQLFCGAETFVLDCIASQPKVTLLSDSLVTLKTAEITLTKIRQIKFRRHSKAGKFETLELLSNLPIDAKEIIELSAQRWRATETEFRMYQHEFGLEQLYVKDPEKAWTLLLLVEISVQLLQIAYQALHYLHGGKLYPKDFREGFYRFLEAFPHDDAWNYISPCTSPLCPYRRKRGERWK